MGKLHEVVYGLLKRENWDVRYAKDHEIPSLVKPVNPDGQKFLVCGDGRKFEVAADEKPGIGISDDIHGHIGARLLGGVLAVASLRFDGSPRGIRDAVHFTHEQGGYVATLHGDHHHGEKGCKFAALWEQGIDGLPEYKSANLKDRRIIKRVGGIFLNALGNHEEEIGVINFLEGHTPDPQNTKLAKVDAWLADILDIPVGILIPNQAAIMSGLPCGRRAVIIPGR